MLLEVAFVAVAVAPWVVAVAVVSFVAVEFAETVPGSLDLTARSSRDCGSEPTELPDRWSIRPH